VTTKSVLDGFARTSDQEVTSDPNGSSIVATTYDPVGRVGSVTNPYYTTSDPTYGVTQYNYDALNRLTSIVHPDSTQVQFTYTGAAIQMQDEGNNSGGTTHVTRVQQLDGLGRLASVCEVSSVTLLGGSGTPVTCGQDITATGFLTIYSYDVLNNITSVSQPGVNSRTYTFDELSRLTQEANPESGTTTYKYDTATAGDLYTRVRPLQNQTSASTKVTTTYSFDSLHRLTGKTYSDGTTPTTIFQYDQAAIGGVNPTNPKGHLTNTSTGPNSGDILGYDTMGRLAQDWQCTPYNCGTGSFPLQYAYDYLGDVKTFTNQAEGNTYTYSYDAAARLTTLQTNYANSPATVLTVNSYNALGEVTQATLGNGIVRTLQYDTRGRTTSLTDGSLYSFSLGYAPDTSVLTGNDSVNGNWTYTYDDFGHVSTSSKTGQSFNWKYDPAGNRWQQNAPQGGPAPQYVMDANNHISASDGVTYDAAGNVSNDGFHSYAYDAEGRLLTVDTTAGSYVYDAFGRRVRTTVNSQAEDFVYDQNGRAIDQFVGSSGGWWRGEVYGAGMHLATYTNSTTYFDHSDWLGTIRAHSNTMGASVETCASLAFGDAQNCTGTDWSPLHYTGQSLDPESNLTHFLYRQLSTTQGRWTTPDPAGLAVADASNPQTWNRYAYVLNNPLSYIDPSGLECVWDDGSYDSADDPNTGSVGGCSSAGGTYFDPSTFSAPNGDWSNQANAGLAAEVGAQPDYTFQTQANAPMPSDSEIWWGSFGSNLFSNWSWGVRGPNQTYRQCLAGNSGNYSLAGAFNQDSSAAKLAGGNDVASLLFGDASEGQAGLLMWEGGSRSLAAGVGTVGTMGRRTASIFDLNLSGVTGPAPAILAKTGAEKVAAFASGAAEFKFALDTGATGSLMLGCLTHP
jgi:RHS repeat-associated protein